MLKSEHSLGDKMLNIELEQETDGRWIGEIPEVPGVMVYGKKREDAARNAEILFFKVMMGILFIP